MTLGHLRSGAHADYPRTSTHREFLPVNWSGMIAHAHAHAHRHWLLDRQDPRTVLIAAIVILAVGGIVVVLKFDQGPLFVAFGASWLLVSVGQLIWAAIGFRRWRAKHDAEP